MEWVTFAKYAATATGVIGAIGLIGVVYFRRMGPSKIKQAVAEVIGEERASIRMASQIQKVLEAAPEHERLKMVKAILQTDVQQTEMILSRLKDAREFIVGTASEQSQRAGTLTIAALSLSTILALTAVSIEQRPVTGGDRAAPNFELESAYQAGHKGLRDLGVVRMWSGTPTLEEDARLRELIRGASQIRIITYSLRSLFEEKKFGPDARAFFEKPGTSMHLLLANPNGSFFLNNTRMLLDAGTDDSVLERWKGDAPQSIALLRSYARSPDTQLKARYYADEMRLPILIFDDNCCVVELRLSGVRSSIRMEIKNSLFVSDSISHFEKVWEVSANAP